MTAAALARRCLPLSRHLRPSPARAGAIHPAFLRTLRTTAPASHGQAAKADAATGIPITFVLRDGSETTVHASPGASLLDAAHAHGIDLEGACEGSLACSTCHVYVDEGTLKKLDEPCDDENDMLDLAFALREDSRLGCQIVAGETIRGVRVTLPPATRNMAVDGFVPTPH